MIKLTWCNNLARRMIHRHLRGLQHGRLRLIEGDRHDDFGNGDELQATIWVRDPEFYRRAVAGGGLGVAESYLRGHWGCDDLTQLVRLFTRNMCVTDGLDRFLALARRQVARWEHRLMRRNSRRGSRKNIAAHYDLGNDFYQLFLDSTWMYSCAVFDKQDASLEDASVAKLDRICRQLDLQPGDHVLEIGTGWGGFALHAAKHYGCRVTTTTISSEQHALAAERIAEAGLQDAITLLKQDYRDLTGTYDKLVSIEMIEAIGEKQYATFFQKCGELMKPGGMMLLQSIVMDEARYAQHRQSVDFIRYYIFPGGHLPNVSTLLQRASRHGRMRLLEAVDLAPHYARTLQCWRDRFLENLEEVRRQGFDQRFERMWQYYLSYCEAVFLERRVGDVQLLLGGETCRHDPIRRAVCADLESDNRDPELPRATELSLATEECIDG